MSVLQYWSLFLVWLCCRLKKYWQQWKSPWKCFFLGLSVLKWTDFDLEQTDLDFKWAKKCHYVIKTLKEIRWLIHILCPSVEVAHILNRLPWRVIFFVPPCMFDLAYLSSCKCLISQMICLILWRRYLMQTTKTVSLMDLLNADFSFSSFIQSDSVLFIVTDILRGKSVLLLYFEPVEWGVLF